MKIPKVTNKIQSIVLVKNEHNNIIHAYPVSLVKWVFLVVILMVGGRISEVLRFVSLLQYGVPFKLQPSTWSPWLSWWLKSQCKNGNNNIEVIMNSMKLVIPLHFISWNKDSNRRCDTATSESIHTKDESKRGFAFAFIFGVNWPNTMSAIGKPPQSYLVKCTSC